MKAVIYLKRGITLAPEVTITVIATDNYDARSGNIVIGSIVLNVSGNVAGTYTGTDQDVNNQADNHTGQDYFADLREPVPEVTE